MPNFEKSPSSNGGGGKKKSTSVAKVPDTRITDPRCHTCNHEHRKLIDRFLVRGTPYAELSRVFGVDAQSIRRHDLNHLNIKDAATRLTVRQEAEAANVDFEEGVRGILKRRVYLETALDKALQALLDGETVVEARDAVAIIDKLDSMETETREANVSQMKVQLQAYLQAMKEIVPEAQWDRIIARTRELASRATQGQLESPENDDQSQGK